MTDRVEVKGREVTIPSDSRVSIGHFGAPFNHQCPWDDAPDEMVEIVLHSARDRVHGGLHSYVHFTADGFLVDLSLLPEHIDSLSALLSQLTPAPTMDPCVIIGGIRVPLPADATVTMATGMCAPDALDDCPELIYLVKFRNSSLSYTPDGRAREVKVDPADAAELSPLLDALSVRVTLAD